MKPGTWANHSGSSPLTRGKPDKTGVVAPTVGLIPAHAGKTTISKLLPTENRAHPRSRGENDIAALSVEDRLGSSPLTRGKPSQAVKMLHQVGLIPAHAGKTSRRARLVAIASAHPRSRGENHVAATARSARAGSSPLTRGKHFLTCAFTAQIDQILETLELAVSSGSYSIWVACATDAPQDQVRSIGLVLPSSRGAS